MDYSKLSKEQLIELLKKNSAEEEVEENTAEEEEVEKCLYTNQKDKSRCSNPGEEKYKGFCEKHKNTVQAKKLQKEQHEEAQQKSVSEEPVHEEEEEEEKPQKITAKKNKWGYYEHEPTKMVFDYSTKKVIGKMNHRKGVLYALTAEDKETCDEYGMLYSDSDSDEE